MKICIVTHSINRFGGFYVEQFARHGHDVIVCSLTAPSNYPNAQNFVIGPTGFDPQASSGRAPYIKAVLPLRKILQQTKPDIVFALYMSSAGIVACLSGHPRIVLSARGSDINSHIDSWIWRRIFHWQGKRSALIHAVSEPLAESLRIRAGIAPEHLLVCPIGVDTETLGFITLDRRPNSGRIISTRSHGPLYDHTTIVKALAILKRRDVPFHITFASANDVERTKRLISEYGMDSQTTFLGGYQPNQLPDILRQADIYVSTSLSDGTSSSLLEAMSTGLFPVVSDIPANRPWVEHGISGYLFKPGDDAALADQLDEAMKNPQLRQRGGERSRQIVVERGDCNVHLRRLLDSFERIVVSK